ncbi:MAG: hypothetical protein AABY32_00725 [Nanoarchaeota archaeon]
MIKCIKRLNYNENMPCCIFSSGTGRTLVPRRNIDVYRIENTAIYDFNFIQCIKIDDFSFINTNKEKIKKSYSGITEVG